MESSGNDPRQAFAEKMTEILNLGAVNLAMAIGYRARLFEVMDKIGAFADADQVAQAAGLNGRYVKEWLAVMVCAGVVELSEDAAGRELFRLPAAHADLLTLRSGSGNLGVYTQEIPLLTRCAMEPVIRRFERGGGIGYEGYPEFQQFMSQLAEAKHRKVLVQRFLPSVEEGRLVGALRDGIRVCDLGCAEGVAVILMAEAFPNSHFTGIDISEEAISEAAAEAGKKALGNVEFVRADAAALASDARFAGRFDYVTAFDAIHDQSRPDAALAGVFAILRPGGRFSMVDIAAESRLTGNREHPMGAFLYTVSLMHCMPVGLNDRGMGLGMMWGRQRAEKMLAAAGFSPVEVLRIPEDPFNLHFFCRRPGEFVPIHA